MKHGKDLTQDCISLAHAVKFLKEKGIVHGHINPGNILVYLDQCQRFVMYIMPTVYMQLCDMGSIF